MANQRMKRMTKGNTKGFFVGMQMHERFTSYFSFEQTNNKAIKAGYAIDTEDNDVFKITDVPWVHGEKVVETPDVRSSNVYPVLRANNANVFFKLRSVGDEFAYLSYTYEQVQQIAALCGFEIEHCERFKNGEILRIKSIDTKLVKLPTVRDNRPFPVLIASANAMKFFADRKVGDEFGVMTYTFEQLQEVARHYGFIVEQCDQYVNGIIARIKSVFVRQPEPEPQSEPQPEPEPQSEPQPEPEPSLKGSYTVSEAALAISAMLAVRMGYDDLESRATFMIGNALNSTMFDAVVDARDGSTEDNFTRSYGLPYAQLRRLAHVIDNIQLDGEGLMAAGLIASLAGGFVQHNYALLAKAGIPEMIYEWGDPSAGAIKRIDTLKLSDRSIAIVTVRTREEEDWFSPSDSSSIRFAKYEDALLYCLFGEHHSGTVGTIYRAISH